MENRPAEVSIESNRPTKVRVAEVRAIEDRSYENHLGKLCPIESCTAEFRARKAPSGEIRPGEFRVTQVCFVEIRSGQVWNY